MGSIIPLIFYLIAVQAEELDLKQENNLLWSRYKALYNTDLTGDKDSKRLDIFIHNVKEINKHNKMYEQGLVTYKQGVNMFTGMLLEEKNAYRTGYVRSNGSSGIPYDQYVESQVREGLVTNDIGDGRLPDSVNWRERGMVTDIKAQKNCGSCWAFSAIGSLEVNYAIKTGKVVALSEQQLIDCSKNNGCSSGNVDRAFEYIKEVGGIEADSTYPYKAIKEDCKFSNNVEASITDFVGLPEGDEKKLQEAVAYFGAVSCPLDSRSQSFLHYAGGVYYDPKCTPQELDHAMTVIGYGTTSDGTEYWLLKNSWGPKWGENGYMRLARNRGNHCGVATAPTYPVVGKESKTPSQSQPDNSPSDSTKEPVTEKPAPTEEMGFDLKNRLRTRRP